MANWVWRAAKATERGKDWWKLYPIRGNGCVPHAPQSGDQPDPRFPVGAAVRLAGKPEQVRRVLGVEWHSIRREYCYVVETSAGARFRPYWFAAQLTLPRRAPEAKQP